MPHQSLTEQIRRALGGTATPMAAELALHAVIQAISAGLKEDGAVRLSRFGTFELRRVRPRRLRLPHSGAVHELPIRTVIRFHPSPVPARLAEQNNLASE